MRNAKIAVLVVGLAASFTGCAANEADPAEDTVASAVFEESPNYVLACGGLALRFFDDPNATVKTTYPYGTLVQVGQVDWNTRMANIKSPTIGWMRIDGANGPLLSRNLTACH
jgi:hypothetical protein